MTKLTSSGQASPPATLDCPKCQNTITYYDVTGSSYYGCPNCHSFFKYEYEGPPEILTTFQLKTVKPILALGAEGYLNGQFVRVTGFMHKKEAGTSYDWTEYMLLQQDGSTIQLSNYIGHWMIIRPIDRTYKQYHTKGNAYYVDTAERQYRLYNRYKATVLSAVGEFDWNILDDEKLTISEYINPPYMLIAEEYGDVSDWYIAQHINQSDIQTAFGLNKYALPDAYGIGAVEPADPDGKSKALFSFTGIAIAAIILFQIHIAIVKPSKQLLNESYQTQADSAGNSKTIVTPSFDINGPTALKFNLFSDLNNQWIEVPVTLINEQSGRIYEFTKTLEYYYGVESGESWSEGSRDEDVVLSRIPSGRYHLNIYPANEPGRMITFRVKVEQNTMLTSNLVLMLMVLVIYPGVVFWRNQWYESRRWSNSDFADSEE
ncbi:DUF4178 domain-containing protein [Spirosoma sp. KNUC1025]|uniref:DUF4178 domain-containing protein n=1 Tax=Spirosoma sp. KNUC1025 TaxID=2894082 RepID=UPI00386CEAE5|nr:DUF4178 domain-containing protein [Spirosoma sp. KNUC1025]